jgi:hypothetical protein
MSAMTVADAVTSMLAAGGKPGGVLCSTADEHKFTVHGIPVRASNYVPLGFAFLISEEAWVMATMRLAHSPYRPIAWMDAHEWGLE